MSPEGLWQRVEKVPLATQVFCHWLLFQEKFRRKRNDLEKEIVNYILSRFAEQIDLPNIDLWRFPDGLSWNMPCNLSRTLRYVHSNSDHLHQAWARLADKQSRRNLLEVLAFRALGPQHVRLPACGPHYWEAFELAKSWIEQSTGSYGGFDVFLFKVPSDRGTICLECWLGNIVYTFVRRQYFFSREQISIQPDADDVVLDLGACFGDTALAFAMAVGEKGRVYAFDPLPAHRTIFKENLGKNPELAPRVVFVERAVSAISDELVGFSEAFAGSRFDSAGLRKVKTISVDDFVERERVSRVDFIKMDIEGSELLALQGSRATIERYRPKLAISIYHRPDDLYQIIEYIDSMDQRYRMYVEQYTTHDEEVILYAHVPD
jgi:FkbM family methyltransferase